MLRNGKNTDSSYLLECFDQIIYFQALNFLKDLVRVGEDCLEYIKYPLGGNFPPPPKKKEGLRVGSNQFDLLFNCILMLLNIAFQLSCKKGNMG